MNNDSLNKHQYQYDVCFSFSGNERGYVQNVANLLKNSGVRIFMMSSQKLVYGERICTSILPIFIVNLLAIV